MNIFAVSLFLSKIANVIKKTYAVTCLSLTKCLSSFDAYCLLRIEGNERVVRRVTTLLCTAQRTCAATHNSDPIANYLLDSNRAFEIVVTYSVPCKTLDRRLAQSFHLEDGLIPQRHRTGHQDDFHALYIHIHLKAQTR